LNGAPLPQSVSYLWSAYIRLHARRSSNGFGSNPLTWSDIEAFSRLSGIRLLPWEVEIIESIDNAYIAKQAEDAKAKVDKPKSEG